MMRKNTKKIAPIVCAVLVAIFLLVYVSVILAAIIHDETVEAFAVVLLLLVAAMILAAIVGLFLALRQRLKEIDKGEEEDAKIY